ncbi:hypothetical protein [Asticcacaulis benevestitus]|uniref:DUF4148 domain-containing protein n=1 Tax=Asticcacaulis benevestitus DSM 16100 = ATCC BAA-896 TaxID=1121022 RepID=V4P8P6_9CAUL|nr:hypothetical protein [Asticcacaulis benevestitus]ESQ81590.1 hypothetical protein ABENE_21705 [Asticcacaulis benevestitus DSM 16100 = ATCC BAA-896]
MKTSSYVPALLIASLLTGTAAVAQTTVATPTGPTQEISTPPAPGTAQHDAQLKREHDRALAAGDHANDPYNSTSSDALNQHQAARAAELGTAPVPVDLAAKPAAPEDAAPVPPVTIPLPADPDPTQGKPVDGPQPPIP